MLCPPSPGIRVHVFRADTEQKIWTYDIYRISKCYRSDFLFIGNVSISIIVRYSPLVAAPGATASQVTGWIYIYIYEVYSYRMAFERELVGRRLGCFPVAIFVFLFSVHCNGVPRFLDRLTVAWPRSAYTCLIVNMKYVRTFCGHANVSNINNQTGVHMYVWLAPTPIIKWLTRNAHELLVTATYRFFREISRPVGVRVI